MVKKMIIFNDYFHILIFILLIITYSETDAKLVPWYLKESEISVAG